MKAFKKLFSLLLLTVFIVGCTANLVEPEGPIAASDPFDPDPPISSIPHKEVKKTCDNSAPGAVKEIKETDGSSCQGFPLTLGQYNSNNYFWDPTIKHGGTFSNYVNDQNLYHRGTCNITPECEYRTDWKYSKSYVTFTAHQDVNLLSGTDYCNGNKVVQYEANMFTLISDKLMYCSVDGGTTCVNGCSQGACNPLRITLEAYSTNNNYTSAGTFSGSCNSGSVNVPTTASASNHMNCKGGDITLTCNVPAGYKIEHITNEIYVQPTIYKNCNNSTSCSMTVQDIDDKNETYYCMINT